MPYDPSRDAFAASSGFSQPISAQARKAAAVVASDANDLAVYAKALYVGGTGDVKVIPVDNLDASPVTFKAVPSGTFLPVQVRRVLATGTTATDILALN